MKRMGKKTPVLVLTILTAVLFACAVPVQTTHAAATASIDQITATSMRVNWNDPGMFTTIKIYRNGVYWKDITTGDAGSTTDTGLTPGASYYYKVTSTFSSC